LGHRRSGGSPASSGGRAHCGVWKQKILARFCFLFTENLARSVHKCTLSETGTAPTLVSDRTTFLRYLYELCALDVFASLPINRLRMSSGASEHISLYDVEGKVGVEGAENKMPTHRGMNIRRQGQDQLRLSVFLSVCLSDVRALNEKRLDLSTPNLVHIIILYSSRSTCVDPDVKGQRSRSHAYENRHGRTVAATAVCSCCRRGSACRYDCLFSSYIPAASSRTERAT